ncbi:MAG TPA: porin, partial [Tepidisphaeraceae bacterium]|nr:porin [Tepidisphaeraceae bacterium]
LTYEFKLVTERDGGDVVLEDAWVQYEFAKGWAVLFGQFRDPVFNEELVSSKYLLAADRSLVNRLLGAPTGFVQGVSLVYGDADTPLHSALALHDGAGSINTDFRDSQREPGFVGSFGVAGRAEYKLAGDWKNYKDFTALGTKRDLLVVGAAADWTQGPDADIIFGTADAQWETATGFGLYAAVLVNAADVRRGTAPGTRCDWGGLVQASYLFAPQWEAFARYDVTLLDHPPDGGGDTFNELTVGVNHYFGPGGRFGHRAKFTLDLTYLPDGAPSDATGLGILASEGDQFVIRGQFQLVL